MNKKTTLIIEVILVLIIIGLSAFAYKMDYFKGFENKIKELTTKKVEKQMEPGLVAEYSFNQSFEDKKLGNDAEQQGEEVRFEKNYVVIKKNNYIKIPKNPNHNPKEAFSIEVEYKIEKYQPLAPLYAAGSKDFLFSWALRQNREHQMELCIGNDQYTSECVHCEDKIKLNTWEKVKASFDSKTKTAKITCKDKTYKKKIKGNPIKSDNQNLIGRYKKIKGSPIHIDMHWDGEIKNLKIYNKVIN